MNELNFLTVLATINALDNFTDKYQFSFQFWGKYNNNVFIYKDDVEIYSSGDHKNIREALVDALKFVYRINNMEY